MFEAYIIHRYKYSETSLLLKVFTREQGMIPVIAKGARGPKSKIRGLCEPFVPVLMDFAGRGEVKTLKQIDVARIFKPLKEQALLSGLYLNELLLALLPAEEPIPSLFARYQNTLEHMVDASLGQCLREFEWQLLAECGYELSIELDQDDQLLEASSSYMLSPGQLPVKTQQNQGQHIYKGSDLLAIAQGDFESSQTQKPAKRLLGQWLDFYTNGKLIKTRKLLRKYYEREKHPIRGER